MQTLYTKGRSESAAKGQDFARRYDQAQQSRNAADIALLSVTRRQLTQYAQFPYDESVRRVLAELNK